jgi:poly(glycerol-phosphate) alpha-glucosyltransferase
MLDSWARRNSGFRKFLAWWAWEKKSLTGATCIHALCQSESEEITHKLPAARICTIPNGITPPSKIIHKTPNKRKVALFLGRLHPKKGLPNLIIQWSDLPRQVKADWELVIAGPAEGSHLQELRSIVDEKNLGASVTLQDAVYGKEKDLLLRRADLFILPSYSEGLPMAVLEAWAYQIPVLMTLECNLPEGFSKGAAHQYVHDCEAKSLYSCLIRDDLSDLGRRGMKLVHENFLWSKISNSYVQLYRDLLKDG